jgi:hypothetical protein
VGGDVDVDVDVDVVLPVEGRVVGGWVGGGAWLVVGGWAGGVGGVGGVGGWVWVRVSVFVSMCTNGSVRMCNCACVYAIVRARRERMAGLEKRADQLIDTHSNQNYN